jgi:hypothetical protein
MDEEQGDVLSPPRPSLTPGSYMREARWPNQESQRGNQLLDRWVPSDV